LHNTFTFRTTTEEDSLVAKHTIAARTVDTMANYLLLAFVGLAVAYLANNYRCYTINLAAAKKSGFPYITMPVHTFNRFWLITHRLWLPFIRVLPKSWLHPWIE